MKKFILSLIKGTIKFIFMLPAILTFLMIMIAGLLAAFGGDGRLIDLAYKGFDWFMEL